MRIFLPADPVARGPERRAAQRELARYIYRRNAPDPVQRFLLRILGDLGTAVLRALAAVHADGAAVLFGAGGALLLAAFLLRRRLGPLRRVGRQAGPAQLSGPLPSATYRRRAQQAAAAGDWELAVSEAMRALARLLEERAVLDVQPGRTARELARSAAAVLPDQTALLDEAATVFTRVRYGGRGASRSDYDALRRADAACAGAPVGAPVGTPVGTAP